MTIKATLATALLALSVAAAGTHGTAVAAQEPARAPLDVSVTGGTVSGAVIDGDIEAWLGIPYAAPPVGPLRWRPPEPVKPWIGTTKARTLPSACAQNADLGAFARAGGNEDCLYLNVYRSADAARAGGKLPVFVWIHGGALQVGQGADYDPSKLARRGGAVVVTINYRLGVFGFLAHEVLDSEGHAFANYGLLDQQAALRWIQSNIAAFGGDPGDVTIAGESSGGNSVMLQIASPGAAGTFQHGIAMSGAGVMTRHPGFGAPMPLKVAEELGAGLARDAGCEVDTAACLRSLSTRRILDTQTPYLLNEAIIDGTIVPMHPADAYRTGKINRVTLVSGSTHDEARFFVALPELASGKALTAADYPVWLDRQYGKALAARVQREYALDRFDSPSEAFAAAATDSMFACTGLAMHRSLADKIPLYVYEFNDGTAPTYVGPTTFPLLASHTYELSYVFPGFRGGSDIRVPLNPLQEKLSNQMVDFFAHAARLPSREAEWPRFDPVKTNVMTFILPAARITEGRFAAEHHCGFWDRTGSY